MSRLWHPEQDYDVPACGEKHTSVASRPISTPGPSCSSKSTSLLATELLHSLRKQKWPSLGLECHRKTHSATLFPKSD